MTKARLTYVAVIACLVLAFVMALLAIVPSTSSDGSV